MRIRNIFLLLFVTTAAVGQQINPVPDYIFRNQMSVGRNAPTDTAAYLSVGPRFGAVKGLMPPMVVDTNAVTGVKRNGLLIFSIQKNRFLYWDSVRVRWSDMAGSSGAYITGEGTVNYLPKFGTSSTLTNSAMYDSSGFLKIYSNNIGNVQNFDFQNPVGKLNIVKDGLRNYGLVIQQNDSVANQLQLVVNLRKGLLTDDTVKTGYGVGIDFGLQSNTKRWRRSGWIANRIVDSAEATFKADMAFMVNSGGTFIYPLIVKPDSTIRVLGLAGSGTRNVVADANGDLRVGSGSDGVDSVLFATRAWRQKGDDSVSALVAAKLNISDTATMLGAYLRKGDTASMLTPYVRTAGFGLTKGTQTLSVDSALMATRARVQKAVDSLGSAKQNTLTNPVTGMGTTNRLAKFTASGTVGNGSIADSSSSVQMTILSDGNVGIGTSTPNQKLTVHGATRINKTDGGEALIILGNSNTASIQQNASDIYFNSNTNTTGGGFIWRNTSTFIERMRLTAAGNLLVGTTSDDGTKVNIAGNLRTTTGANFATSSGDVGIGTTSPSEKLHINRASAGDVAMLVSNTVSNNYFMTRGTGNLDLITTSGSLQFSPNTTERMRLTSTGLGINTTSPSEALHVTGRGRFTTIDSSASPINMLWADNSGVIKKTAVPSAPTDSVKMRTATITAGSGFTLAKEAATGTTIDQVVGFVDASGLTTVKLNGAVYKTTATFTTGSWVTIATIAEYRPNNDVYFSLPNLVSGESFESTGNVDFTAAAAYSGATSLRVRTNGDIQAYVGSVDASADLSGANYVILPIVVSYPILTLTN